MNASTRRGPGDYSDSSVVGEFCLETEKYLIVALSGDKAEGRQSLQAACLANSTLADNLVEIARFEINGCSCVIFKDVQKNCHHSMDLTLLLSGRELQIATLVAQGYGNKQIATHLNISEWTVSSYVRRIFSKLGVDNRPAMVYRCAPLLHRLQNLAAERI